MKIFDELRHPSGGEGIDGAAQDAVRLAHRALNRFPELVGRHKFIAGGAAISSALVALAGVAIARRMHSGQSADEAVDGVTEQELSGLRIVDDGLGASEEEMASADDAEAPTPSVDGDAPEQEPELEHTPSRSA